MSPHDYFTKGHTVCHLLLAFSNTFLFVEEMYFQVAAFGVAGARMSSDLLNLVSQSCGPCVAFVLWNCIGLVWSSHSEMTHLLYYFRFFPPLLLTKWKQESELLPSRQYLYILSHLRRQILLFGGCRVIICGLGCLDSISKHQPSSAHITQLSSGLVISYLQLISTH